MNNVQLFKIIRFVLRETYCTLMLFRDRSILKVFTRKTYIDKANIDVLLANRKFAAIILRKGINILPSYIVSLLPYPQLS
jgi:hypothetical protein